jgi:hypothetical protein
MKAIYLRVWRWMDPRTWISRIARSDLATW